MELSERYEGYCSLWELKHYRDDSQVINKKIKIDEFLILKN